MDLMLGINCFHPNSSLCLLDENGKIIFFSEEERFNRIKNFTGFPNLALKYINNKYCNVDQIKFVIINSNPFDNILKKTYFFLKNFSFDFLTGRLKDYKKKIFFSQLQIKNKIYIDHHLSHIASSFYLSNFKECVALSIDGFGDFSSLSLATINNNNIKIKQKVFFPHSLGIFYHAMTQFIGFNNYGDEYKVMGMSAYGNPQTYYEKIKNLISYDENFFYKINTKYFNFYKKNIFYPTPQGVPIYKSIFSKNIEDLIGKPRQDNDLLTEKFFDLAACTQKIYEEIFFKILNKIYKNNPIQNLCLSGGCAMNSLANGKIILNTSFKNVFIPATPGDSGGAIGAALYFFHKKNKIKYKIDNSNPYLGSHYENYEIKEILNKFDIIFQNKNINTHSYPTKKINFIIAEKLSQGSIIAIFRGKMENGPRALGNRSLLGDPRQEKIAKKMNLIIKKREEFRPFAPSILEEFANQWYENCVPSPYMSHVFKVIKNKKKIIPAVTHVDGTGRIQTVNECINSDYYDLIKKFYNITSVPMILNTSFNDNEPIIENPQDAINFFIHNPIDYLVLENYLLEKK